MIFRLVAFVIALLFSLFVAAQTQQVVLAGKVMNEKNEPLAGVSVKLTGNGGTATDMEGRYSFKVLGGQKYELEFTAIGYSSKVVSDIEVSAGASNELITVLEIKTTSGENVVVTARTTARRETAASMISFQKNTSTVAAVISAESIRRSPDKNTGEVLKRIPGTSVQEGKYLVVRGLSDRYNQAMLNGVQLASTEPDRKAFSFDIFPAAMIDNMVINKAFVPEYPGEWAGGLVQVNTKDIPSKSFFTVQVGTGFNLETIGENFYTYKGSSTDWLGFDNGARSLPNSFPLKNKFKGLSDAEKTTLARQFATNWSVTEGSLPLNTSFQVSGGFNGRFLKKDVGGIVALTYNRSSRRLNFDNRFYSINGTQADINFDYTNDKYSQDVLAGLLANFSVKLNNYNRISIKNILNVNSTDYVTLRTGKDYEADPQFGENVRARELAFKSNTFYNTTINGEHTIRAGNFQPRLNWYGSFAILDQYVPQQRRLQYTQAVAPGSPWYALISGGLSQKTGSIFYSSLNDYIYNAGGDIATPFTLFNNKQTVKLGYLFQVKDRLYDARPFSIYLSSDNPALRQLDEDHIFSAGHFGEDGFNIDELQGIQYRYLANTILNAAYIQFDNQFGKYFRVVWGARYENFDQLIGSVKQSDPRHVYSEVGDLLPAVNATYKLNPKTNIRLAASQTVVRPEFRELSPLAFFDFELGATILGNKNLQRTKVSNVDLRYELYPRAGEVISLGTFFKHFENPIELFFNQSGVGTSNTFNYLNVEKAVGYGIEFEIRKKLDMIPALSNMTFQSNVSYIFNEVKDAAVNVKRPMQGQSPYVINASLQYDIEKIGLSSTLLFNQIGRRILYVGNEQIPAIWEAPRPVLDLQIAKKFGEKSELRLNIADLLNRPANFYHDLDENKKFKSASADAIAIRRIMGTTIGVTYSYQF